MDAISGLLPALEAQWEGAAQWLYYDVIFDFIHREIDTFRDNMLHEMMRWVGGSAAVLLVLWMAWFGVRILQGKVPHAMEGVVDTARVAFVVTVAMTMTVGNGHLYEFLVNDLPMEITQVMTGEDQRPEDMVNQSLARMEAATVPARSSARTRGAAFPARRPRPAGRSVKGSAKSGSAYPSP